MIQPLLDHWLKEKYQQACALALALASGSRKSELLGSQYYFSDENIIFGSLYRTPEKLKPKGGRVAETISKIYVGQ